MLKHTCLLLLLSSSLAAQTAYAVDTTLDQLFTVDLTTGAVTLVVSVANNGLATAADLCWRDDTQELWTIDLTGGEAGPIDPVSGNFTVVWNTGVSGWQGMAWDHTTRLFYCHNQNDTLYTLDPATGTLTTIGVLATTTPLITAIEVDAIGRLWGMDFSAGAIVQLDKTTGQEIGRIPTPGMTQVQGMAIAGDGTWYAISTGTDSLYAVDPLTGASVLLGPNTGTTFVKGFAITGSALQRGGEACADGAGQVRRMQWSGGSNIGNIVLHSCDAGAVPTATFFAYGFSATQAGPFALPLDMTPFGAPGCKLLQSTEAISGPVQTGSQAAFAFPADASLVGFTIWVQCPILDTSGNPNAAGMVFSDALKMTITL